MEQRQKEAIMRRLEEEKHKVLATVKSINEGLGTSMGDSLGELSLYDNNPGDVGTELFERSKDLALREDARLRLRAIDEALKRLEEGKYGLCEACGREIAPERLEAVPWTTFCLRCRRDFDRHTVRSLRPVEEEIIADLYRTAYEDELESVMYDTEDSWQDVARYFEHAGSSGAGSYYGPGELEEEDRGFVEDVDNIPYEIGDDGVIYENRRGFDDERAPAEMVDVGIEHEKGREGARERGR